MSLSLALLWFGLIAPTAAGTTAAPSPEQALVLVRLPDQPDQAIVEALNRLRGEAMSVGFEVRLVDAADEALAHDRPGGAWAELRPAAVVTVARPDPGEQGPGALDVTFFDQATGKTSVARLTAGEVRDGVERADVIIAVRAVDFIRARMFDALAGRRPEPPPPPPPPPVAAVSGPRRYHVAGGLSVLGTPSGFAPAILPRLAVGYAVTPWLRLGVSAAGLGSRPEHRTAAGGVGLDQRYVGAHATLASPIWRRCRLLAELGGGEYWVTARGEPVAPYVGRTATLSSLAASTAAGLAVLLAPSLSLELWGGALWLHSEARISATDEAYAVGRPLWLGGASVAASF